MPSLLSSRTSNQLPRRLIKSNPLSRIPQLEPNKMHSLRNWPLRRLNSWISTQRSSIKTPRLMILRPDTVKREPRSLKMTELLKSKRRSKLPSMLRPQRLSRHMMTWISPRRKPRKRWKTSKKN